MHPAFGLLIAYVAGSFPSAYLTGRLLKGIDLRTMGSGNLGATNVYRNLGLAAALVVLALDAAKGALPVYFLPRALGLGTLGASGLGAGALQGTALGANGPSDDTALWWTLAYGVAAIAGHAKPVFLLWKGGGKGVATAAGAFAVLVPLAVLGTTLACAAAVWFTGYMSVGSVVAALLFPLLVYLSHGAASPVFLVSLAVCAFIVWTHRSNFARLRAGTEHRLFRKAEKRP